MEWIQFLLIWPGLPFGEAGAASNAAPRKLVSLVRCFWEIFATTPNITFELTAAKCNWSQLISWSCEWWMLKVFLAQKILCERKTATVRQPMAKRKSGDKTSSQKPKALKPDESTESTVDNLGPVKLFKTWMPLVKIGVWVHFFWKQKISSIMECLVLNRLLEVRTLGRAFDHGQVPESCLGHPGWLVGWLVFSVRSILCCFDLFLGEACCLHQMGGPAVSFGSWSVCCSALPKRNWSYCKVGDLDRTGHVLLRPWHLPFTRECGLKGVVEPVPCLISSLHESLTLKMPHPETQSVSQDSHAALCQIMVAKGWGPQINECNRISNQCVAHPKNCPRLKTDASIPGVERLSISSMRPDAGCNPPFSIPPTQVGDYDDGVLWPLHAFMVKGWSRSLAAVTVMLCAYEEPSFLQAWIIFGFDVLFCSSFTFHWLVFYIYLQAWPQELQQLLRWHSYFIISSQFDINWCLIDCLKVFPNLSRKCLRGGREIRPSAIDLPEQKHLWQQDTLELSPSCLIKMFFPRCLRHYPRISINETEAKLLQPFVANAFAQQVWSGWCSRIEGCVSSTFVFSM